MKVFKNPTKNNSYLIDVTVSELKYLESYFGDLSINGKITFASCFYRARKFYEFYKILKSCQL